MVCSLVRDAAGSLPMMGLSLSGFQEISRFLLAGKGNYIHKVDAGGPSL